MSQKTALKVGAAIFGLVALFHILRLVNKWDVAVGSWNVPMGLSVFAAVATIGLSYWYWKLGKYANR